MVPALDGVARDVGPDAVHGVEEGCAGEGRSTPGGVIDVVVWSDLVRF